MRLVLSMFVVLAVAVSSARAEQSIENLVADLAGQDGNRRNTALNELRRLKDPRAIPLILRSIEGWEYMGRYYGVMVLESYPPDLADRAFRTLAGSESPYLRLCAGAALFRGGDERGADLIVKSLGETDDEQMLQYMFQKLYSVRQEKVSRVLRGFLRADRSEDFLAYVLSVLHSQQDRGALPDCRRLLEEDHRSGVRALAAAYLFRFGEEDGVADLAEEIRSGGISSSALIRIESFLNSAGTVAQQILDALSDLLDRADDTNVLCRAIAMLGRYRYAKARSRLTELLEHENHTVAKAAFDALASIPGGLDAASLLPLLSSDDPDRRLWAAHALRRMDDLSGFQAVVEVLGSGTDSQRLEAARVLGGFRIAKSVEPLIGALMDGYSSVRSQAASGLLQVLQALFPYRSFDLASAGYSYSAPEAGRRLAVERIRKWWAEARPRDW